MRTRNAIRTALAAASVIVVATFVLYQRADAQTYRDLCLGTPQESTAACAALKSTEADFKKATRRAPRFDYAGPDVLCANSQELMAKSYYYSQRCVDWREARQAWMRAGEAARLAATAAPAGPLDTELPVIQLAAPDPVEAGRTLRLSGLVGDNGSPPRLKVNGQPVPLYRPDADATPVASYTMAFDVELPAGEPGSQRVTLEACDGAGNCVAERADVTVVAAAAPAPVVPSTAPARVGLVSTGSTYRELCTGTTVTGTAECARLGELETARERLEARVPQMPSESFYPMPATIKEACTEPIQRTYRMAVCKEWRRNRDERQKLVAGLRAKAKAQPSVAVAERDIGLPVIRVTVPPARVQPEGGPIRIAGLVGDETSPPRLKVNGKPVPLFRLDAGTEPIAAHTLAFDIEVPAGAPGEQRLVLEACDAAGNCVAERTTVTVIASATPGPAPRPTVAVDTKPPEIRVAAPRRVETGDKVMRIAGLVGDDGSPPEIKVNGEPAPLSPPGPNAENIAANTLAFDVEVPIGQPGTQHVTLEACDAAGNCTTERPVVTVVASAAPAEPQVDMEALIAKLKEQQLLTAPKDTELPRIRVEAPAEVEVADSSARITGLVGDNGSPPRLKVNGNPVPLFEAPAGQAGFAANTLAFDIGIDTQAAGKKAYVIEVCDAASNCLAKRVAVSVVQPDRPSFKGKNYALIIGNDTYDSLPDLKTPINDAKAVAEVLKARYAFDDENMTMLLNSTRADILGQFERLRDTMTPDDRLMIYYAGHGQIDPVTDEGFWQPTDARPDAQYTWINNGDIKRYLRAMPARHVLIVADSCFSGSLTRGSAPEVKRDSDRFFTEIDSRFSRKVITSGGTEPVADSGSGNHSIFAYYFLKALARNKAPYVTSAELFTGFVRAVTNNSDQKPEYGTITGAGDEGAGDFTFIRRE